MAPSWGRSAAAVADHAGQRGQVAADQLAGRHLGRTGQALQLPGRTATGAQLQD